MSFVSLIRFAYPSAAALLLLALATLLIFTSTSSVVAPTSDFRDAKPPPIRDFERLR